MSRPARRALLTAALALPCAAVWASPAAAQLRGEEVRAVRFEGNRTFPADSLARAIATRETDCRSGFLFLFCSLGMDFSLRRAQLRQQELPRDRARLAIWYQRRGFLDVAVASPVVQRRLGGVEVLFRLTEGRPVLADFISFEGHEEVGDADLLDDLPLRPGDRLSTIARDATQDTLVERLQDMGYAHADVFFRTLRPADNPYSAQVTFEIEPGPLARYGAIEIEGLENLSPGTIRRTLRFNSGGLYRDSDIEQARARLFGLEIIRSATVEPDLSAGDSIVPVTVLVQEGDAYRVRYGGGWTTAECLNLEARWTSRNFFGGGRRLQLRGRLGNLLAEQARESLCNDSGTGPFADATWVASVELSQPWIFSTANSFTATVFFERQTLPDIFIRRAIGFQAALTRQLGPRTPLTFFYRPELTQLDADDVLFCIGFLVCRPSDIVLLEGANWLAPVGVNLTRDRSDDLLNPRRGYRLNFDVEHAADWTGSNFRYDRLVGEVTAYEPLGGPVVLATRARVGWVGSGAFDALLSAGSISIIHPQRRFFAGGANSVRGYAQSRLGPRVFVVRETAQLLEAPPGGSGCTPESVMDLTCNAGVGGESVVFGELPVGGTRVVEGNAEIRFPIASWVEGVAFTDFGQAWGADERMDVSEIEFTPGFGLRFPSPVGPIRLDVAYRPSSARALSVVTPQLRLFDPMTDAVADQIQVGGTPIPYVQTAELALLSPTISTRGRESRIQLHVSIGQAF